jgi:hypothetical protein
LLSRNELLLDFAGSSYGGEVRLEVRAEQYLRDLRVSVQSGMLRISGLVAGEPIENPLELVVRDAEQELLYAEVVVGKPFNLAAPGPIGHSPLEVRLIRGGMRIWESRSVLL